MNYKRALHNEEDIVSDKSVKTFSISLLLWILSGFVFLAIAAYLSSPFGRI